MIGALQRDERRFIKDFAFGGRELIE